MAPFNTCCPLDCTSFSVFLFFDLFYHVSELLQPLNSFGMCPYFNSSAGLSFVSLFHSASRLQSHHRILNFKLNFLVVRTSLSEYYAVNRYNPIGLYLLCFFFHLFYSLFAFLDFIISDKRGFVNYKI